MSKDILISVIIPAYNAEKYIKNALDSVMNQTILPSEIIVVDDGSLDNTSKTVRDFYPRVKLYKQQNKGPSSARNLGIQKASGDWITFLDADDEWLPKILENYCQVLEKHQDLTWCCTPYLLVNARKTRKIQYQGKQLQNNRIKNYFLAYQDFKTKVISELVSTCSVIIQKEIFNEIGLFNDEFKSGEDIDLWFRIALKYPEIGYASEVGFKYLRINSNSITSNEQYYNNIRSQIFRINKTWTYLTINSAIKKSEASFVLNVWVFRILKTIIKKNHFHLINALSIDIYDSLNIVNRSIYLMIKAFTIKN